MPFFQPKRVQISELTQLHKKKQNIRNICITAHVDHGKTSLCDALLMSNGIVNFDGVGNYRFMDSRPDEQTRGITMKSSSIMLMYEGASKEKHLVNLIDTPGHVDFTSEVSSAIQMCEGTIVVIDVVEGVCSQTQFVLQQCFVRNLDILLFFNKIDRLINEMNMDSVECYYRLYDLLEKVNSIFASFIHSSEVSENVVVDAEKFHFSVYKKNVLFGSAVDGWAIDLPHFVRVYSKKWDVPLNKLAGKIWSDYYFDKKSSTFVSGARNKGKRPVFVSVILDNIFYLYKNFEKSEAFLEKIKSSLEINVNTASLHMENMSVSDVRKLILQRWQYLPDMVFSHVVKMVSPPVNLSTNDDACFIVSKLVIVDKNSQILLNKNINSNYENCVSLNQQYLILLFAKVVNGVVSVNSEFVLFSGKNERNKKITINHIFGIMGNNCYVPVNEGCAGNVVALSFSFSTDCNLKTLKNFFTVNSVFCSESFTDFDSIHAYMRKMNIFIDEKNTSESIFKVVIEPKNDVTQMKSLFDALKVMSVTDNSMSVEINDTSGDCLLSITGEVHLQKILFDLKQFFYFDHELVISPPIVPFKETIIEEQMNNENTENYLLPYYMRNVLNEVNINKDNNNTVAAECSIALPDKNKSVTLKIALFVTRKKIDDDDEKNVISTVNDNVLCCTESVMACPYIAKLKHGLISGFKISVKEGPLMNETMSNVCFCITEVSLTNFESEAELNGVPAMVWYSNAMSRMKLLCIASFVNSRNIRLMLPVVNATVYTDQSVMKKTYSVLSKRHAKILEEDHEYNEFVIKCEMLAIESFGMVQELYDKCKGLARASFAWKKGEDGWTVLDQYPFVVQLDEDELVEGGGKNLQDAEYQKNLAFKYIKQERLRKGLPFINQLVESGEKQRTLKKNK